MMTDKETIYNPTNLIQFDKQMEYLNVTDDDRKILKELAPLLLPKLPGIISSFYDNHKLFPITQPLEQIQEKVDQLHTAHLKCFEKMLQGVFDKEYIRYRKHIGELHIEIKLPPKGYIGAYSLYCEKLVPILAGIYHDSPHKFQQAQMALLKVFLLDMQVEIDSYISHYSNELIETRNALENKLWMEDRLLSFILNEANDAIIGLDEQDRISTWSQGAQDIFGYKTLDTIEMSLYDLVLQKQTIDDIIEEAKKNGYAILKGAYWKNHEGNPVNADAILTYLCDRQGEHIGSTLLIKDMTEIRRMAEKVKNMEQLAAMTKITAGVAHEIRTPMNIITLTGDLLQNRIDKILDQNANLSIDEDRREINELLSDLQTEIVRMNEIVDHYLVLSRIKRPSKKRMYLKPFLEDITREFYARKIQKIDRIELITEDDISIELDRDHFRRVFHNLYDNSLYAIKESGQITIRTTIDHDYVVIEFCDNGIGIPKDKINGILSAFVTHRPGGTGLGLYLVREIVEAHHGTVNIESETGNGAIVRMRIPLAINRE